MNKLNIAHSADTETHNWLCHGRSYDEQRFSPLTQINDKTVSQLNLAWHYDLPDNRGQEATPLIADGVLQYPDNSVRVDSMAGKLKVLTEELVSEGIKMYEAGMYMQMLLCLR